MQLKVELTSRGRVLSQLALINSNLFQHIFTFVNFVPKQFSMHFLIDNLYEYRISKWIPMKMKRSNNKTISSNSLKWREYIRCVVLFKCNYFSISLILIHCSSWYSMKFLWINNIPLDLCAMILILAPFFVDCFCE